MQKKPGAISLCIGDFLFFFLLPAVVTLYLSFSRDYGLIQVSVLAMTSFLQSLPSWLIPIAAPGGLLLLFLGLPILTGIVFHPRYGNLLFGSLSLTLAVLLVTFTRWLTVTGILEKSVR